MENVSLENDPDGRVTGMPSSL